MSIFLGALLLASTSVGAQCQIAATEWTVIRGAERDLKFDAVRAAGRREVIRLTVSRPVQPFYQSAISHTWPEDVAEGMRVRLRFRARSATRNPIRAVVEKNGPPFTAVAEASPMLEPVWKEYVLTGTSAGYGAGGLAIRFQVGHQAGVIELAEVTFQVLGKDPELEAARGAVAPAAVQERIARHRKGLLQVRVMGAEGRPVSGARVQVEQVRHAFLFGCNLFNLEPENREAWQTQYQRQFIALFNYATLPFYWGAFEPEAGRPQYERLEQMARWCAAHGIVAKGHPLIWQEVWPGWAPADPDAAIPLLQRRVEAILSRYRGLIRYWDVVNEANSAADHANGQGAWVRRDGPVAVVTRAMEWARKASRGTDNVLIYNDFNVGEAHLALLEGLQRRRALPDAIGLQSHMHRELWSPERVWMTVERFARFKKPVHFTEITVVSGPSPGAWSMQNPPSVWPTTPEGEREQADYLEQFYTLLFSHPAVQAITYWDFSDRNAWLNAPAGLLRADMTPKPAYERLYNLIRKVWWTRAEGQTDRNGQYAVHAFYGEHRITVTDAAGRTAVQTVTLHPGRRETRVTVLLR